MKFGTKAVHAGNHPDPSTGAINTPIYQTSTYAQEAPGKNKGYAYARGQNPSREAVEKNIADLENGDFGLCFSSGIAAVDAILRMLKPGDEVITTKDIYGGSYRLFVHVFQSAGIKFNFIDLSDSIELKNALTDHAKLVWLETPTNPMMNIIDIQMVSDVVKEHGILVAVDNTFATPYLQNPLDLGADIVMHSATKYLGGHSDLIMGAIVVREKELYSKLKFIQNTCGAIPGPNDCFLVQRGIKTLHLRMDRSCENAMKIALFLHAHPKVNQVYYPGLETHSSYDIAKKQMSGYGAMISFDLKDDQQEAAFKVLRKFKLFCLAESLGGVESLCGHPASMSHGSVPKEDRDLVGIKDSMIRLSIGVEEVDDLIEDISYALGSK